MDTRARRGEAGAMAAPTTRRGRTPASALFWRLFLFNALVFIAGAAVLVLSPATVSTPVSVTEVAYSRSGGVMLGVNALLLRAEPAPAGRADRADGAGRPAPPRRAAVGARRP